MAITKEKLYEIKSYLEGILKETGRVGRYDLLKKYRSHEFSEKTDPDSVDSSAESIFKEINSNGYYTLINNEPCKEINECKKLVNERKGCNDKEYTTKCLMLCLEDRFLIKSDSKTSPDMSN